MLVKFSINIIFQILASGFFILALDSFFSEKPLFSLLNIIYNNASFSASFTLINRILIGIIFLFITSFSLYFGNRNFYFFKRYFKYYFERQTATNRALVGLHGSVFTAWACLLGYLHTPKEDFFTLGITFGVIALLIFIFLIRLLKKIINVFALNREFFIYFYSLENEEQAVIKNRSRFQGIYLNGTDDFLADIEPNLTVLSQENFIEELEDVLQKDLYDETKREIEMLRHWIILKNQPIIGYQCEKNTYCKKSKT